MLTENVCLVPRRLVYPHRMAPRKPAIGRHRECHLVDCAEAHILPYEIEIAVSRIERDVEQDGGIAHQLLSIGRYAAEDRGDRRGVTRAVEGRALVERANEADPCAAIRRDLSKEVEHGSAWWHRHNIVDRLRIGS